MATKWSHTREEKRHLHKQNALTTTNTHSCMYVTPETQTTGYNSVQWLLGENCRVIPMYLITLYAGSVLTLCFTQPKYTSSNLNNYSCSSNKKKRRKLGLLADSVKIGKSWGMATLPIRCQTRSLDSPESCFSAMARTHTQPLDITTTLQICQEGCFSENYFLTKPPLRFVRRLKSYLTGSQ